jgi:tRNA nucleotidyltransferase (CCA-adding enzyme)
MFPVLEKIKPIEKEEKKTDKIVRDFLQKLDDKLVGARAFVGGSFGKGTWLKGDHDIDVFVRFEEDQEISDTLELCLQRAFSKIERVHGSRDYFQVIFKGLNFEIVPVFKIEKAAEAHNVTDVSPLHVKWVRKNSTNFLRDEIRLAKQFCKAQKVYGAETYIKGFSGYVMELLVIYYGSFKKFIEGVSKWKIGQEINPGKNKFNLNPSKISPLLLIDPVQPNRNTAAAVSLEKFKNLISGCKKYNARPRAEMFRIKKVDLGKIHSHDVVFFAKALEGKKDNVGTKLLKAQEEIENQLNLEGFKVLSSGWEWEDIAYFWYDVKHKELKPFKEHAGPPKDNEEHAASFRAKHFDRTITEVEGKLYAVLPRKYRKVKDFAKTVIKLPRVKERVRAIKLV